jgi:hypothetical protein
MTEERFEQMIEGAADRVEQSINRKWRNRSFRLAVKSISALAETGLIIGSFSLKRNGYHTAAAWCFWLGIIGIAEDIITVICFKKK